MVGLVVVFTTLAVAFPGNADSGSITINGIVTGAPPATAPVITAPVTNTQVSSQQITVSGTCTTDLTVVVTDNQVGRGSALCDQNSAFSLTISLSTGTNALEAYHLDGLNQSGPTSNTVIITYQPAATSPQTASATTPTASASSAAATGSPSTGSSNQFTVAAPYRFDGVQSGQSFTLHGDLEGGTAPYAVQIEWGDGTQTLLSRAIKGVFTVQHTYAAAGQFVIKLIASDADGLTTYFQTTVSVAGPAAVKPVAPIPPVPVVPAYKLAIIWPVFLIACLTVFSFWLGERYDRRRVPPTTSPPPTSL